jgi:hypothetical protein
MPTVIAQHKVGNFQTWLKGHQDREQIFAPAVSSFKTFQDKDDPNSITLVMEVTDMDKLVTMMNDPKTQELKNKHTVVDPIRLSMPVTL